MKNTAEAVTTAKEACAEACSVMMVGYYREEVMSELPGIIAAIAAAPLRGRWTVGDYSIIKNPAPRYNSPVGEAPIGIYKTGLAENARTRYDKEQYECVSMMEVARYLHRNRRDLFGE